MRGCGWGVHTPQGRLTILISLRRLWGTCVCVCARWSCLNVCVKAEMWGISAGMAYR